VSTVANVKLFASTPNSKPCKHGDADEQPFNELKNDFDLEDENIKVNFSDDLSILLTLSFDCHLSGLDPYL
jgi:hypothetical protein